MFFTYILQQHCLPGKTFSPQRRPLLQAAKGKRPAAGEFTTKQTLQVYSQTKELSKCR
jgi:hypothetical protein